MLQCKHWLCQIVHGLHVFPPYNTENTLLSQYIRACSNTCPTTANNHTKSSALEVNWDVFFVEALSGCYTLMPPTSLLFTTRIR